MEQRAGERVPVAGDLTSGAANTGTISGWPTDRIVRENEPILCDLGPRANGYWGDSCNTIFVGEPGPTFMKLYTTTQRSVEVVRETLRPGISAAQFDRTVRAVFEREGLSNPIHTGHGIGTGVHEWPRLVPHQDVMLEEGMVLMIEPRGLRPRGRRRAPRVDVPRHRDGQRGVERLPPHVVRDVAVPPSTRVSPGQHSRPLTTSCSSSPASWKYAGGLASAYPGAQAYVRGMNAEGAGRPSPPSTARFIRRTTTLRGLRHRLWDAGDVGNLTFMCDKIHDEHDALAGVEFRWGQPTE